QSLGVVDRMRVGRVAEEAHCAGRGVRLAGLPMLGFAFEDGGRGGTECGCAALRVHRRFDEIDARLCSRGLRQRRAERKREAGHENTQHDFLPIVCDCKRRLACSRPCPKGLSDTNTQPAWAISESSRMPPAPPVLPTERIAHLVRPGDRCTAGFQALQCALWVICDRGRRSYAPALARFTPKADK